MPTAATETERSARRSAGEESPEHAVAAWVVVARALECLALFGLVPLLIYFDVLPLRMMMLMLGIFGVVVLAFLLLDRSFPRRRLWNTRGATRELKQVIPVFLAGALVMLIGTIAHDYFGWGGRELLFGLPQRNTGIFIMIMLLYPLFSVYPQELIYRAFFFHRYAVLFRSPAAMIMASALAFGWAHVIFENLLALGLSTVGGLLFAWTYHRSKSLAACWLEHSLYGDWLFTVGLGWYFFTGSVGA